MNYNKIKAMQKKYGVFGMQENINSGLAWRLEGSYGREAMRLLRQGACMLPKEYKVDYYGNRIPSRDDVKSGTTGSYSLCRDYWENYDENLDI